jgi:tetratricopeptide (TPR) repeat protein
VSFEHLGSLFLVQIITAAGLKLRRSAPVIIAAWAYFLATLLPVIGIVQVGAQAAADRYMYLPILGPLMLLGAISIKAWEAPGTVRCLAAALAAALVIAMSFLTLRQIPLWKDSVTLWTYVIEKEPGAYNAHNNLGTEYLSRGLIDRAIEEYESAVKLYPGFSMAHYNLGNAYRKKGNMSAAKKAWEKAVEIRPGYSPALNQLGNVALLSHSLLEARGYFDAAVRADPANAKAHYNLAFTLEKLNETDSALKHYQIFLNTASSEYAHLFPAVRKKLSAP